MTLTALLLMLVACGGGNKASTVSLFARLAPAGSLPGFDRVATLAWNKPIDLVGQGLPLPESTYPSAAVKELQTVHLKAAEGEVLRQGTGLQATDIVLGVAEFDSPADAAKAQNWLHLQDLQQPCFGACIFSPRALKIARVPDSAAVVQTLANARPSDPANYRADFTINQYLYWAWFSGDSRTNTRREFVAGIADYYHHAAQKTS